MSDNETIYRVKGRDIRDLTRDELIEALGAAIDKLKDSEAMMADTMSGMNR